MFVPLIVQHGETHNKRFELPDVLALFSGFLKITNGRACFTNPSVLLPTGLSRLYIGAPLNGIRYGKDV